MSDDELVKGIVDRSASVFENAAREIATVKGWSTFDATFYLRLFLMGVSDYPQDFRVMYDKRKPDGIDEMMSLVDTYMRDVWFDTPADGDGKGGA